MTDTDGMKIKSYKSLVVTVLVSRSPFLTFSIVIHDTVFSPYLYEHKPTCLFLGREEDLFEGCDLSNFSGSSTGVLIRIVQS